MNAVAQIPRVSPVDQFVGEVLPPERRTSLFSGLPSHIKPAVFERNLVNAVMANPNLMKYDPRLVYREVSKAAGLGLLLDPQLGEAYILEAYNYKTKSTEPQLRVGYRGLNKLARQSGEIDQLYAHEVYSADYVECELGDQKKLIHKPILFSDRGEIVGYYAVVKYKNGETDFEPMSVKQVHDIRDRSDAWKAFAAGKIKSTPWSTDEEEMAKKGLALDTPIPTPSGWTTMADLSAGQEVFDKDGIPVEVIAVSEVKNLPCFRVTFSCGDTIICDDEHRWLARSGKQNAHRLSFSVQTVNELYDAKLAGLSVTIPVQLALSLPTADLPIDPYLLGYWLGDGTSNAANITCNAEDRPFVVQAAERAGYVVSSAEKDPRADAYTVRITEGFQRALRETGLQGNKHVPAIYMRGSIDQRRQLLFGLMDSDGCIEKGRGRAKFCSTSLTLADAVYELAVSLGETPCRHSNEAKGFGVTTMAHWVEWLPTAPCVTLPRKVANLKPRTIAAYRAISSIERIESVPTKCIAVTSPSKTYLAGRSMAPTHNTILRRLVKRVPQSPELQAAIRIEDQADVLGDVRAIPAQVAAPRLPPAAPRVPQVTHQQQDDAAVYGGGETLDHDPETGEIDAGTQQETQREPEKAKPVETKQEPKPAAKAAPKVAPKAEQQDQPAGEDAYDPAPILAKIKALFDGARDEDHLEDIRAKQALPLYERLKRSDQEAAILLYQEASARVAPADAETAQDDQQQDENAGAGEAIKADGSAEDDTFPGDRPSKTAGAPKQPSEMNAAEYEAYVRAGVEAATDPDEFKKQWFSESEIREQLGLPDALRKSLRALVFDRVAALREA